MTGHGLIVKCFNGRGNFTMSGFVSTPIPLTNKEGESRCDDLLTAIPEASENAQVS